MARCAILFPYPPSPADGERIYEVSVIAAERVADREPSKEG
jgi:hypothetical protein